MKFEDVMTSAEAAERWGVSPVTVKQACSGQRNTPPRFTSDECRKSKGTWLVSRQGMERVYGEERIMLKVIDTGLRCPNVIAEVGSYKEAWVAIVTEDFKGSPCVGEYTLEDWMSDDFEDLREKYPGFQPGDKMQYIYLTEYGDGPIVEPKIFNRESVNDLLSHLRMSYRVDEE